MQDITLAEKQRALKISSALQLFFDQNPGMAILRSTDAYEVLVTKGLVERDRHHGIKFREFLHKLKNSNALAFLPQCRAESGSGTNTVWIFQSAPKSTITGKNLTTPEALNKSVELDVAALKKAIDLLPKRKDSDFDFVASETRKIYPRAYEYWSEREKELLKEAGSHTEDSFKLSDIFGRQPSAIEGKLKDLNP